MSAAPLALHLYHVHRPVSTRHSDQLATTSARPCHMHFEASPNPENKSPLINFPRVLRIHALYCTVPRRSTRGHSMHFSYRCRTDETPQLLRSVIPKCPTRRLVEILIAKIIRLNKCVYLLICKNERKKTGAQNRWKNFKYTRGMIIDFPN